MDLTEEQWAVLEPLLPEEERLPTGRRGRPREVLSGILWVLRTGAPCKDLPKRYPPYQRCHRRFQICVTSARSHEVTLLEPTLAACFAPRTAQEADRRSGV